MDSLEQTWIKRRDDFRAKPKFLKSGTLVTVKLATPPTDATVDGKYGKRKVNVIETEEYGLIYISDLILAKIVDLARTSGNWQLLSFNV